MTQFNVTGMSCAACSARVEKAVSGVAGVTSCAVNLLTNSMNVDGTASVEEIISAVENAGYGAFVKQDEKVKRKDDFVDKQTPKIRNRLIASLVFMIPLMYISMGHTMWGWSVPSALEGNHILLSLCECALALIVMIINNKFFINGFKGLIHKAPNMDTLVALGSGASFVYSVIVLIAHQDGFMHNLYFESAAMILTLITVGKMLESYSKGKTTNALKGLVNLAPKLATVVRNGIEQVIPAEELQVGDVFVVKPAESIPADAVVVEGESTVDESALTGESVPVDKAIGDNVSCATINQAGYIKCKATRVGGDTMLSQIIKMVSDASATKAPIAKLADKVSGVFVPVVMVLALIAFVVWLVVGSEFSYALSRGISVLVISCPCALGLATPVAIMVGSGKAAKNGILFKNATSLEEAGRVQIVALDKTGTITEGKPSVTEIIPIEADRNELLSIAYSIENKSEHPLAKAIVEYSQNNDIELNEIDSFKALAGNGVEAVLNGEKIIAGSFKFVSQGISITDDIRAKIDALAQKGNTPLLFSKGGKLAGIIAVADVIKADSPKAIAELQNMGIKVVMLTGDNKKTANAIAQQVGVDMVIAELLPNAKESVIKQLMEQGKVAMVGDGINDAPALTRANVGIAIGAGTDIAIDSADIVLMNSSILDVASAIRLSRRTLTNIKENLFWAFIYNVIGIPLAAGVWYPIMGWSLSPMFGAAAMSLSSFCVVMNALRLNLVNPHSKKHDIRKNEIEIYFKEEEKMTKVIKIEGMMCPHCEAHAKKALEALPEIDEATPSHEKAEAVLVCNVEPNMDAIKAAIEEAGYKVID